MKTKKIKLLLIGCIFVLAFALGGCIRSETSFVVNEDNSLTINMRSAFNKEKANAVIEETAAESGTPINPEEFFAESGYTEETIHGEQYYVSTTSMTYTQKQIQEELPNCLINKDKFYLYTDAGDIGTDMEKDLEEMGLSKEDIEYIGYSVTMPSPIVKTNGKIQEDQRTAVWDINALEGQECELYAYTSADGNPDADKQTVLALLNPVPSNTPTVSTDSDTKAPVIKGIKKNKSYKKKVTVYVKDNRQLKKVTVNGKKAKLTKVKKGKYKGYFKFTVKGKGKKTIVAYDAAGNKKKISIKIK